MIKFLYVWLIMSPLKVLNRREYRPTKKNWLLKTLEEKYHFRAYNRKHIWNTNTQPGLEKKRQVLIPPKAERGKTL